MMLVHKIEGQYISKYMVDDYDFAITGNGRGYKIQVTHAKSGAEVFRSTADRPRQALRITEKFIRSLEKKVNVGRLERTEETLALQFFTNQRKKQPKIKLHLAPGGTK